MIAAGDHDYLQTEKPIRFAGNITKGPIIIEDNVWIGANCTITDGVRIGRDAVIAANSVVTTDVAPYDLVGGAPAKFISNRKNRRKKWRWLKYK
jgi:acetyltransferase-like isoleucine patch superfamily enzyme